jgi:alpha-L-fucosidase
MNPAEMKSKTSIASKYFVILLCLIPLALTAQEQHSRYYAPEDSLVRQKISQWQDLKFGLLMHWGPYSQWGVVESWSICSEDEPWCYQGTDYAKYRQIYEQLPTTFNPKAFDPSKWARAARDAGMKYMVFTTKHHDGFCMFDTKTTDYRITAPNCPFSSNPKADVTREIFNAFRVEGFMVGAYFSKPDWHSEFFWWPKFATPDRNVNYDIAKHPDRWKSFVEYTHAQIDELATNYGKLDILWLDGGWVHALSPKEMAFDQQLNAQRIEHGYGPLKLPPNQDVEMDKIAANARKKQPGLIVVDRAVEGKNQNYLTPEQTVPPAYLPYPWETCMTMGESWSYNFHEKYKSTRELIHLLADVVSKGGNLLLNIGPGPDGQWHTEAYDRLKEIGEWMNINHDAIYNTKGMEVFGEGKFRFTLGKNGSVYAIFLASESDEKIPATLAITTLAPPKKCQIRLLGYNHPLRWERMGNGIRIFIPEALQVKPPSPYAWVLSISAVK